VTIYQICIGGFFEYNRAALAPLAGKSILHEWLPVLPPEAARAKNRVCESRGRLPASRRFLDVTHQRVWSARFRRFGRKRNAALTAQTAILQWGTFGGASQASLSCPS